jgi:hypothetical protein
MPAKKSKRECQRQRKSLPAAPHGQRPRREGATRMPAKKTKHGCQRSNNKNPHSDINTH